MSTIQNKISLKQLISLAGVATSSIFLSFPALAQTSNGCANYQGNPTTGGGYYCALDRLNWSSPNREASTMDRQSSNDAASPMNQQSTTGAGYPGNGVTSNSGTNTTESPSTTGNSSTMDRQSNTTQSSTIERRSTTSTTYTPTRVTPNRQANTMEQPQPSSTTDTTTVNQSTDQGVRALW